MRYTDFDHSIDTHTESRSYDILVSTSVLIVLHKIVILINSPTKSRTYNTQFLTSVSIVLHRVGLTTHWSQLVYQQSYKMQDLRYNGLDHRVDIPIVEQNQRFVELKSTKIVQQDFQDYRFLVLSHVGILIRTPN